MRLRLPEAVFVITSSFGGKVTVGTQTLTSGYGQVVVTPITGCTATGGARYDSCRRLGGATTLAGSGVYTPNGGATTLRASYSEGFKVPSLYQLQSEYGNQLLRPERSRGWDEGITQCGLNGRIEASANYFRRESKDLINLTSCGTPLTGICVNRPFGTYDNVARAVSKGVELTLLVRPVNALTLQANYTSLDAENCSPGDVNFGKQLIRQPSQGYVVADVRAVYPRTHQLALVARVDARLNEKHETIYRYGTFGRAAAYGGVRLSN